MNRIDGYINLDEILNSMGVDTTSFDTIISSGLVEEIAEDVYSFTYNNEKYYYKYSQIFSPYSELIGECLLDDLNIPHVSYDLATLCGRNGVVSKDFTKDNAKYVSGLEILENYTNTRGVQISIFNNLEDIWNALDLYFKDNRNKDEIVAKLMNNITDLFMFDMLVSNNDRNVTNWGIEIDGDNINLSKIYDNQRIGYNYKNNPVLDMNVSKENDDSLYENLEYFLNISDSSYREKLNGMMWIISEENILDVFRRIELKTDTKMPDTVKNSYLDFFNKHRDKITEVVENTNKKNM